MQVQLSKEVIITGNKLQVEKAKVALEPLIQTGQKLPFSMEYTDIETRVRIQNTIELFNLSAVIVHKGHRVWCKNRIISNLHKVKARGTEYLSNYFYDYITECCGTAVYFNKAAWIKAHPTVDAFGKFFLKNDYGKNVCDYIPEWKSDARRIAADIERYLFPFQSYLRSRSKKT